MVKTENTMRCLPRKALILTGLLTTSASFLGCSSDGEEWIAYHSHEHEIAIDNETVPYTVLTSRNYQDGEATPLIFALHYSGQVPDSIGRDFLRSFVEPALGNLEAVMVAPKSVGTGGWTTESNEGLVLAVLDSVNANYSIDPDRVLVLGYSMGATGAWHFIARFPHRFTAAIPISGMPDPRDPPLISEQNILVIHSRADELFPLIWVEEIVYALQFRSVPISLEIVEGLRHGEIEGFVDPLADATPWVRLVLGLPPVG
jgi:predicted peptidase